MRENELVFGLEVIVQPHGIGRIVKAPNGARERHQFAWVRTYGDNVERCYHLDNVQPWPALVMQSPAPKET